MQKDLNRQLDQKDKLFDEAKNGQKKAASAISDLKKKHQSLQMKKLILKKNRSALKLSRLQRLP